MLNKKNMARVMTLATVVSAGAPAFAATLSGTTVSMADAEKMAELREEVKGLLETTYTAKQGMLLTTTNAGVNVYDVKVGKNTTNATTTVATMKDLEKEIAKLQKENDYLTIEVTHKGHSEVDGEIVDWEIAKYTKTDILGITTGAVTTGSTTLATISRDNLGKTVQINMLNNDEPMYLTVGDAKITTTAPIFKMDENGNYLDKNGKITLNMNDRVVLGFGKAKNQIVSTSINKQGTKTYTVKYAEINEEALQADELLNRVTGRLTKKGNELAKYIRNYNAKIAELALQNPNVYSLSDKITTSCITTSTNITLDIVVPKNIEVAKAARAGEYATITIKGSVDELEDLKAKLDVVATTGKLETLAGEDRVKTAIEVSKDTFATATPGTITQNVVLVASDVIADGLAATPFANAVNAPVLLADRNGISDELMAEIQRVLTTDGTVYIVGGVLGGNIEAQLDAKFINHDRIAGDDRQGTSLEIAKRLVKLNNGVTNNFFVAGGYAEADTMSVAGVAAAKKAPILLAGANGLTDEQANWVKFNANTTAAFVVGGEAHISKDAQAKIDELTNQEVKRLSGGEGTGRQETNAAVIKEFYNGATPSTVYVVKSDNKGLVDALATGVAAGKVNAPVVLATEELVKAQKDALDIMKDATVTKKQAGYGVADKVWEAIKNIF